MCRSARSWAPPACRSARCSWATARRRCWPPSRARRSSSRGTTTTSAASSPGPSAAWAGGAAPRDARDRRRRELGDGARDPPRAAGRRRASLGARGRGGRGDPGPTPEPVVPRRPRRSCGRHADDRARRGGARRVAPHRRGAVRVLRDDAREPPTGPRGRADRHGHEGLRPRAAPPDERGHRGVATRLAGLGDLVLTCTGGLSRNRQLGMALARGETTAAVERESRMIAEGTRTVTSALALAKRHAVAMPICEEVGAVLFAGKPPADAVASLLERPLRREDR